MASTRLEARGLGGFFMKGSLRTPNVHHTLCKNSSAWGLCGYHVSHLGKTIFGIVDFFMKGFTRAILAQVISVFLHLHG